MNHKRQKWGAEIPLNEQMIENSSEQINDQNHDHDHDHDHITCKE